MVSLGRRGIWAFSCSVITHCLAGSRRPPSDTLLEDPQCGQGGQSMARGQRARPGGPGAWPAAAGAVSSSPSSGPAEPRAGSVGAVALPETAAQQPRPVLTRPGLVRTCVLVKCAWTHCRPPSQSPSRWWPRGQSRVPWAQPQAGAKPPQTSPWATGPPPCVAGHLLNDRSQGAAGTIGHAAGAPLGPPRPPLLGVTLVGPTSGLAVAWGRVPVSCTPTLDLVVVGLCPACWAPLSPIESAALGGSGGQVLRSGPEPCEGHTDAGCRGLWGALELGALCRVLFWGSGRPSTAALRTGATGAPQGQEAL